MLLFKNLFHNIQIFQFHNSIVFLPKAMGIDKFALCSDDNTTWLIFDMIDDSDMDGVAFGDGIDSAILSNIFL